MCRVGLDKSRVEKRPFYSELKKTTRVHQLNRAKLYIENIYRKTNVGVITSHQDIISIACKTRQDQGLCSFQHEKAMPKTLSVVAALPVAGTITGFEQNDM